MTKTTLLKTLSILITFAMLLALLPGGFITVSAATTESGKCGANLTWTLEDGVLTISGTGSMYDYDVVYQNGNYITAAPWGAKSFSTLIIKSGVTSIGYDAFYNCTGLTSVTIPDGVTSIGHSAFYNTGYYNGQSNWEGDVLYLGTWLIGAKWYIEGDCLIRDGTLGIADSVFSICSRLTSVTIPDSVTSIGGWAFYRCTGLTSVTIPDSVTSIGYDAFRGCTALTSVTIPGSVTSIGDYAFSGCSGLASITVAVGNSVYHSSGNCLIETGSKTLINGCKNSIIPDDGSVTSIGGGAFEGCVSLTSVTIPDSVTSIGGWAFDGCNNLTAYVYRNTYGESYVKNKNIKYDYVLVSEITVSRLPDKLSYLEAKETFNAFGGKLTLNYDSGYSEEIDMTADMVSGFDNTVVGPQTLTVTYEGLTATFDIEIIAKSLSGISVWSYPQKTSYIEGKETLDVTGGSIKLNYNNGTSEIIDMTADMVSGFDNTVAGYRTLTVAYGGFTTTFNVYIVAKSVSEIQVVTMPNKTSYIEGKDQLDITGGAVKVCYNDDSVRDAYMMYNNGVACLMFADDFSIVNLGISGFDNSVAGKCTVTISYGGSNGTFDVDIVAKELAGISVISAPNKTVYETGEALDLSGGRIRLSYNNGTYQYANLMSLAGNNLIIIDGESSAKEIIVSGFESDWGGVKTVVISYGGFETSLEVTVNGSAVMKGDADGDGEITVSDALIALRIAAKLAPETPEMLACCDTDGDGAITVSDALAILRVAARIVDSL